MFLPKQSWRTLWHGKRSTFLKGAKCLDSCKAHHNNLSYDQIVGSMCYNNNNRTNAKVLLQKVPQHCLCNLYRSRADPHFVKISSHLPSNHSPFALRLSIASDSFLCLTTHNPTTLSLFQVPSLPLYCSLSLLQNKGSSILLWRHCAHSGFNPLWFDVCLYNCSLIVPWALFDLKVQV